MMLNNRDINILNLAMKIMEIHSRFCRFGIVEAEEYNAAHTLPMSQALVYDANTLDDDGMFTVFSGFGNSGHYHEDFFVRYCKTEMPENDFIEIAVPIVSQEECCSCQDGNCNECTAIGYYQLYLIRRDGTIAKDIDVDETEDCKHCDCDGSCGNNCSCSYDRHECAPSVVEMMHCRESGARNLCHCECGVEHCFVECGPENDENCTLNDNGRCHCPHNRCCGCDCECDPDEED